MNEIGLWDRVRFEHTDWQVIACTRQEDVLRSLEGPGVRLVPVAELLASGQDPVPAAATSLTDLDLLSSLPPSHRDHAENLHHHLHEIEYGIPPRAPVGTRPRPAYDPTTRSLTARVQAKVAELGAVGDPLSERQLWRLLARWRHNGKAGLVDPRLLTSSRTRSSPTS